jgi:hypothetical protein
MTTNKEQKEAPLQEISDIGQEIERPVKSYTGGVPRYATETPDDLLRQSEREGWRWARECEAEVVRLTDVNQDLAAALVACMSVIDANGLGGVVKKNANAALAKHREET